MALREKQGQKGREGETERGGGQGKAEEEGSAAAVWRSELSGYSCGSESSSDSLDQI